MSSIIKSSVVVDDRTLDPRAFLCRETELERSIIKKHVLAGTAAKVKPPPTKDSLLEELNRLKVRICDAEQEIKARLREAEDLQMEIAGLEQRREELEKLEGLTPDDQARQIILEAEQAAQQIIADAKEAAVDAVDKLRAQGYLDGLEQGATEAHQRYSDEHEPDIQKLQQMIAGLGAMRDEMIREYEDDIVNLVIAIAEKIIGKTLQDDPKVVVDMLRDVMERNRREAFIKVTISPDLMPAAAKASDNVCKMIQELGQQVDVSVDTEADPGTLIAETPGGITDLSIPTQLYNLNEAILEE